MQPCTDPWVKIFEAGADGGSIAVMGKKGKAGDWSFAMVCDERTMKCLTDEFADHELYSSSCSDSWEGILKKMDEYPWARLYPLGPFLDEFKDLIWAALHDRDPDGYRHHNWEVLCGRKANPYEGAARDSG